jgi:cytochrome bd-type quinol oxidase subunit 2
MGLPLLLVVLVIVFLAEKNVNQKSAKKQRITISLALAIEIAASIVGFTAGNSLDNNNCDGTPAISYLAWALAITGILLAALNLYVALKGKQRGPIVLASLFIVVCLAAAAFAWFVSVFCLTF